MFRINGSIDPSRIFFARVLKLSLHLISLNFFTYFSFRFFIHFESIFESEEKLKKIWFLDYGSSLRRFEIGFSLKFVQR